MPIVTEEQIRAAAEVPRSAVAVRTQANALELVFDALDRLGESMNLEQAVFSVAASQVATMLEPLVTSFLASLSPEARQEASQEIEHIRERLAFLKLLPDLAKTRFGKYVAVHDGQVVDADASLRTLVRRFSERFGDAPVYIGFVGAPAPVARVPTPFFHRPGQ